MIPAMIPDTFDELPPQERDELALCGISSPTQLQSATANRIIQDLAKAGDFFPDRNFVLTPARINEILSIYQEKTPVSDIEEPDYTLPEVHHTGPTTGYKHGSYNRKKASEKEVKLLLHSPIRSTHPFRAVFAAFCTLSLLIPIIGAIIFPLLLLTDNMPEIPLAIIAPIVLLLPGLLYACGSRLANCPVCHMPVFRFSHYNRNRAAHHLPLLGYNFSTALHLLLLWQYHCPACGTPVKLIGRKGHKRHS